VAQPGWHNPILLPIAGVLGVVAFMVILLLIVDIGVLRAWKTARSWFMKAMILIAVGITACFAVAIWLEFIKMILIKRE
jgi:hypothetical protein